MKTEDLARFLVKLDKVKQNKGPRDRNTPVWGLVYPGELTGVTDMVSFKQTSNSAKWDGVWQWTGEVPWG